jgi:hypothetical protein
MPEEIKPNEGFSDVEKHNAEVAAKLAAQDITGRTMAPTETADASDALDKLAKQAEEGDKKKDEAPPPESEGKTPEELEKEKADKEAADREAAEKEAHRKRADEIFKDTPGLPPGASPKAGESFSAVKIRAAQEIAAREAELEKLKKENAELLEKTKNAVPPETLKELEDHRQWRAKLDVEADPKFKAFDKTVAETHEFIYAQLKKSPVITDEVIDAIKKHGGPENIQLDKIFAAVKDPVMQRLIEAKIADIEQAKFNKAQAIEAAKKNIGEYVTEREKAAVENATRHNTITEKHFNELTGTLEWYKEKPIDPKAKKEDQEAAQAHNKMVTETRANLAAALKDDSPEMRAIMLTGMAQLIYLQKVHDGSLKEIEGLKKSLADITAKYDKLRQGSTTRLRESLEIPGNKATTPAPKDQFNTPAGDALDNLRKQVTEERERAASTGTR